MCSSTTPKTKAASPAVNDPAKITKQPAGGGGGGGGAGGGAGGGPATLVFGGVQEHIPELTFIIEPRVTPDDYLASATDYHTNCGLAPQQIHSIDHMVTLLAASDTSLKRIRIVGHASGEDLLVPLFGQTNVREDRHAFKEHLNAFAISDERGLLDQFGMVPGNYLHAWLKTDILTMTRTTHKALLQPFGYDESGAPDGDFEKFIYYCCDYAFVNRNLYTKNGGALSANEKAGMLKAYTALIWIKAKALKGTTVNGHVATETALNALSDYLKQRTAAELGLDNDDRRNYVLPPNALNNFLLAGRAGDAVIAGFREQLNKVRKRFSTTSAIDIRGCRAGDDRDYLLAVQDFLGQPSAKPAVTAPRWFQAFAGTNSYSHPADRAGVHALLTTGTAAAEIRKGFETWATLTHVDPEHKKVWIDTLDGDAVKFVLLDWRKKLPALPVAAPALTTYLAMNFIDFVNKSADFFNVPTASMPSAATLTGIDTYITTKLKNYSTQLLAFVDGATDQTKLNTILTALNNINTELGNAVTPVPVAPIGYKTLMDYQDKLIKFINDNKIAGIKPFMTAIRNRINDSTDPGLYYYMLFSGMPVFVFADHEAVVAHRVNVQHNRLVILDAFADAAYRTWVQLSWAEPLPAGNRFITLHPADFTSRRSMMMVEAADNSNSGAAVCPHPDYFTHMNSV
jgi:hypothetical protein